MQRAAMTASALAKERRELKEQQQRDAAGGHPEGPVQASLLVTRNCPAPIEPVHFYLPETRDDVGILRPHRSCTASAPQCLCNGALT